MAPKMFLKPVKNRARKRQVTAANSFNEENKITSSEETDIEQSLSKNFEQPQVNVLKVVHHHHHQQVVQVDQRQNITKIVHQPEQSNVRSGNQEDLNRAFDKLKKTTGELYDRKFDVDLSKFDNPASNLSEVYPELLSVDFYEGRFIPNDDQYNPKTKQIQFKESDKKVSIEQLLRRFQEQNFISIVGYPGAGKTTLSKRLARRLDQNRDFLVLRIPFMSMSDEKQTLKEFLLGDVKFNLENDEQNLLFSWMKNHTQNCFFILDGFDQVNWNLTHMVKRSNYDTLLTCQELLSNLCEGNFLPNCHIVFTSRPHAMLTIPQRCRPKQTYFIKDLTSEDMKKLFDTLINDEKKSREILNKLTVKTPHLQSMCHNPLMLQLYVRASLGSSHEILNISTMTTIFHRVLENLKSSDHAVSLSDQIVISLSKLAFKATENKTVLISTDDLDEENLTSDQIQALVVTLFGSNSRCGLLEGNRRLYFLHQTFQEFFSALYIVYQTPIKYFASFVQTNLLAHHWSVVVEFLSGLLLDPSMNKDNSTTTAIQQPSRASTSAQSSSSSHQPSSSTTSPAQNSSVLFEIAAFFSSVFARKPTDQKLQKKQIFLKELYKKTREVAADHDDDRSIIAISRILREGNDEEVIVTVGSHFDGGRILMEPSDTQNDFRAVTSFLKLMPARVGFLNLIGCFMTSYKFRPWVEALKSMPGFIVWMNLPGNLLSVDDVIEVLHKVEREIVMWKCLDDGNGGMKYPNMEERAKLQEALDGLENKKLQIEVGFVSSRTRIDD